MGYNDDLIYNNATDGEVYLEAPTNDEGQDGAETWRFIADKGLYHFKKYQGQWLSRRYSAGVESASSEFSQTIINSSEIDVQSGDIYDLTVTNSLTFTGNSLSLYSFSSPLSLNTTNQAVSLPYTGNLKITNGDLDTIQNISTTSNVTFKEVSIEKDGGVGGNLTIEGNLNGKDFGAMVTEIGKLFYVNYVDGSGSNQSDGLGLSALTASEVNQLENIGTHEISEAEWGYLAGLDQALSTASNVTFSQVGTGNLSFVDDLNISTTSSNDTVSIDYSDKINFNNVGYTSGFLGDGWSIYNKTNADGTTSGSYALEVDDLIVRGSMNVHELVINQIRATNGALIVSDSGKIAESGFQRDYSFTYKATVKFDTDQVDGVYKPAPFAVGDIILHRRVQASDNSVVVDECKWYVYEINVDSDPRKIGIYYKESLPGVNDSKGCYTKENGTSQSYSSNEIVSHWDGATIVRVGSRTDADRKGLILITSQDSQAPFVDVIDGVSSWEIWDGVTGNVGISNGNFDSLPSTGSLVTTGIDSWSLGGLGSTGGAYCFASGGIGGGQYIGLRDGNSGNANISQPLDYEEFKEGVTYVLEFYAKQNTNTSDLSILLGSASNSYNVTTESFASSGIYNQITSLGVFDSSWRKYKLEFIPNAAFSTDTDAKVTFFSYGGNTSEVGLDAIRMYAKDKTKVRLGNLEGVGKSGYGLWGDNVFMDGRIEISEGYIGNSENGWLLDATSILALGSNANISIPSSTGTTGFNSGGVYMSGHATEVFSLGNTSTGNGLTWNGSTLNINGNITIGNIGDINLSEFNNDAGFGTGSGGNYGEFHIILNSYGGSSNNGEFDVVGFDADGNVSATADPRFLLIDGTYATLTNGDLTTRVATAWYQNLVNTSKNNASEAVAGEFRTLNDDGTAYILFDSVGNFDRTTDARPTGSRINEYTPDEGAGQSKRLILCVYNKERQRWYYDSNNLVPNEFVPLSTDYIIGSLIPNKFTSDGALEGGLAFAVAKTTGAIENYYNNISSSLTNTSWSYLNSSGWDVTHTNNEFSDDGTEYWHTIMQWNFPQCVDDTLSTLKLRTIYYDLSEFSANSMRWVIENPTDGDDEAIGYLEQAVNVDVTQELDINNTFLKNGIPVIIKLQSNDEANNSSGDGSDTGKVHLVELYDGATGAGLGDLYPVGTPDASGLYLGSDKLGYWNKDSSSWGVKIERNGHFFFGNTETDQTSANCVQWDGNTLEVKGLMKAGAVESSTFSAEKGTKIDLDGASMKMGGDGTSQNTGHYWFEFDTEATISTMKWKRGNSSATKEEVVEIGTSIANYTSPVGGSDLNMTADADMVDDHGDESLSTNVDGIKLVGMDYASYTGVNYPTKDAIFMMGDDWDLKYPIFAGTEIGIQDGKSHLCLKSQYTPTETLNYVIDFIDGFGYAFEVPLNRGTSGYAVKWETADSTQKDYLTCMPFTSYLNIGVDWNRYVTPEGTCLYGDGDIFDTGDSVPFSDSQKDQYTCLAHTHIGYAHIGDMGNQRWGKNIGFYAEIGTMNTTSSAEPYANHDSAHYTTGENDNAWDDDNSPEALTHVGLSINLLGFGNGAHKNFGHEYGVYVKKTSSANHNGAVDPAGPSYGYSENEHTNTSGGNKKNQSAIGGYFDVPAKRGQALVTRGNVFMEEGAEGDGYGFFYCEPILNVSGTYGEYVRIDTDGDDRGKLIEHSSTREIKEDINYLDFDDAKIESFLSVKPCYFKEKQWKTWDDKSFLTKHFDMWGDGKGQYEDGWKDNIYTLGFIAEDFESVDKRLVNYRCKQVFDDNGEAQVIYNEERTVDDDSKWEQSDIDNPNIDTGDANAGDLKWKDGKRTLTKGIRRDNRVQDDGSYLSSVGSYKLDSIVAYQQGVIGKLWEKIKELESKIN